MKIFKIFFKIFFAIILFVLFFVGFYLYIARDFSRKPINKFEHNEKNRIDFYIKSNGVHTDLVVPVKTDLIDWSREIKYENTISNDSTMKYLAFGWGDKGFYLETPTWAELKFSVAFKAVFYLGTTAMHTTFYKKIVPGNDCVHLKISRKQYTLLIKYIKESFQNDSSGGVMWIKGHSYGNDDSFYEAKGKYSLFYTCNTWANNGLKSCGLRACLWTPFEDGIFYQYGKR